MVFTRWCYRRRFLPRLAYALFIFCFFVVLSGLGILSRLPDGASRSHRENGAEPEPAAPSANKELEPDTDWMINNNKFFGYEVGCDEWQQANPSSQAYKLLVYSAFWDGRAKSKCVRVIGSTITKKPPNFVCRLHFEGGKSVAINAQRKPINEHWNLKYAGYLFSCCSENFGDLVPAYVTVYEEASKNASATMRVHRNDLTASSGYRGQLALCVKPFHYNFNRATWLVEFIEYYLMMGVQHFLFYNESVGEDVQEILLHYQRLDLVEVLPWKMDVKNQKEIRTENMFAALNDCNYRLMYLYQYVISVDLDEYIVPKEHSNLTEMMNSLSTRMGKKKCTPSFVFQNVFFYLYWDNDTLLFEAEPEVPPGNVPYLLTVYKTRRLEKPHNHGKRSKYISVPEMVLEVGNHVTWRHTGACKPEKVPASVAILHHYRICEYGGFDCLKQSSTVDRTAHKFGQQLLNRVLDSCKIIYPALDGQCPVSPPLGSPW